MPSETLPTVYLETSVISYLTARPSRDLQIAAHQEITHRWWDERRKYFHLLISRLVENEIKQGNPVEAAKRVAIVKGIEALEISKETGELAELFLGKKGLPNKAQDDAIHIATATARGVDYLATWNLKHMANAKTRRRVELICQENGFVPPIICTPEELMSVK